MAKKIILFLSAYKADSKQTEYICPTGEPVMGTQTNDAPIRYLLREHPEVEEILCIVTPEAKESAYEPFEQLVRQCGSKARIRSIEFNQQREDFSAQPLQQILKRVERGDEILLDTTGGFRDVVLYLVLLTRAVSYVGVRVTEAVFSKFNKYKPEENKILSVLQTYRLFELVEGMQELTSFGSVAKLRDYYGQQEPEPSIKTLLDAMEQLQEAITLCRTRLLPQKLEEFKVAVKKAMDNCTDPLMRALLPTFKSKFKKLTTPGVIRWCVNNNMLQQALTIYTERIPEEILEEKKGLVDASADSNSYDIREYEDKYAKQLMCGLMHMSDAIEPPAERSPEAELRRLVPLSPSEILRNPEERRVTFPAQIQKGVENIALLAKLAYLDHGGSFYAGWSEKLPEEKCSLKKLEGKLSKQPAKTVEGMIRSIGTCNPEELSCLLEREGSTEVIGKNVFVRTLRNLEALLPTSAFRPRCSVEKLRCVCMDYLYIKALRNMANHANESETSDQKELMEYLGEYGYKPLSEVDCSYLRKILLQALDNLNTEKEKRGKV